MRKVIWLPPVVIFAILIAISLLPNRQAVHDRIVCLEFNISKAFCDAQ